MNLKQMEYILEIRNCGGIRNAAEKLFISQPALSQQLQRTEEELGIRIFDRSSKHLHITFEGKRVLETFETMLFHYRQLENFLDESRNYEHGCLTVAVPPVRAMQFLPILLPEFHKRYPGIQIEIREATSTQIRELLRTGDIDLGLFVVDETAVDMTYVPLLQEELYLAACPDSEADQICRKSVGELGRVDVVRLKDQPFILPRGGSHLRAQAEQVFAKYGMRPSIAMEATSVDLAVALAASGLGLTLVSRLFMALSKPSYRPSLYPLSHEISGYSLGIAYHPAHYFSKAMEIFLEFTGQTVSQLPEYIPQ